MGTYDNTAGNCAITRRSNRTRTGRVLRIAFWKPATTFGAPARRGYANATINTAGATSRMCETPANHNAKVSLRSRRIYNFLFNVREAFTSVTKPHLQPLANCAGRPPQLQCTRPGSCRVFSKTNYYHSAINSAALSTGRDVRLGILLFSAHSDPEVHAIPFEGDTD